MTPSIVIITIAAYFALMLSLSWLAGRKADNATFFTGGRRTPSAGGGVGKLGTAPFWGGLISRRGAGGGYRWALL